MLGKDREEREANEEKPETTSIQFRTSPANFDALKGFDYKKKTEAIRAIKREQAKNNYDNDLEYLNPHHLTMMKLAHCNKFPDGVDISPLTQLIRYDPEAIKWVSEELFARLDMSDGHHSVHYNTRIGVDDTGMVTELNEKYFYNPYGDTLFVACVLLAIDEDNDMRQFRHRFKRPITKIKDYLLNLPLYYEDSIEGIIEAIQTDEISGAKSHIYIELLHEIIVINNHSSTKYINKYKEEFKEILIKFTNLKLIRSDKVALKQIAEAQQYL